MALFIFPCWFTINYLMWSKHISMLIVFMFPCRSITLNMVLFIFPCWSTINYSMWSNIIFPCRYSSYFHAGSPSIIFVVQHIFMSVLFIFLCWSTIILFCIILFSIFKIKILPNNLKHKTFFRPYVTSKNFQTKN